MSAAFDTLNHITLLHRLQHTFGLSGYVISWIRSYLTDRSSFVKIDSSSSPSTTILKGVPQSSVLGPLLFVLFISPIANVINSDRSNQNSIVSFHQYADDTQLYIGTNSSTLTSQIASIESCSQQQEDPLGSLLFSISIHPILERLKSELILGYLDDLTVGGGIDSVCDDLRIIKPEAEILGLKLNASKCEIVTAAYNANDFSEFEILAGFQTVDIRDAQFLGSPIISNRGLNTILDEKCRELERMLDRLKLSSSHQALTVIRNCISVP